MERREEAVNVELTPSLLRVRVDIYERRIRSLEEAQTRLAREIEGRQERGEPCTRLRELERENDILLLDQLQQVLQTRRELDRLEPIESIGEKDDQERASERRALIEDLLCFQVVASGEEQGQRSINGTEENNEALDNSSCLSSLPVDPTMECSICLDGCKAGDRIGKAKTHQCSHKFHADCILTWLLQPGNDRCPVCRFDFVKASLRRSESDNAAR